MTKKTITITEHISELIYDIQNKTYLTGRSLSNGTNQEFVANMQANDDDENANQILRSIANAFSTLKSKLSDYIEEDGTTTKNTLINSSDDLILVLKMPSNYNQSANDTLASAIHQYIVNIAIGDWFTITNKTDASKYIDDATMNLAIVHEAINKRIRPIRTIINGNSQKD